MAKEPHATKKGPGRRHAGNVPNKLKGLHKNTAKVGSKQHTSPGNGASKSQRAARKAKNRQRARGL